MAKPVSEEELQLKKRARRRLIGAIALVAAVAAVLPMVLDSEPKPGSQEINIQIPSQDAKSVPAPKAAVAPGPVAARADKADKTEKDVAPVKSEVKAADAPAASAQTAEKAADKVSDNPNDAVLSPTPRPAKEKSATPGKAAAEKTADKAPAKTAEKAPEKVAEKIADKAPEKVAEKAPEKSAAPKAGPGAYFIQVIALSEADKAKQVQQQIAGAGVRAYTEVVSAASGKVTRVRAGPFASREEAEKAQARLQGIGLEGKVAAY